MEALNKKKAEIIKHVNAVKGGKSIEHQHTEDGRIAQDEDGNDIVLHEAVPGFDAEVMAIEDAMCDEMLDIIED